MYLTSRPIGFADITRDYLKGIKQEKRFTMPDGPVIMSPDRLMKSFKREVIDRKPQIFKIAALKNIRKLFSDEVCPFYGGFGNRDTDAISYRAVGIELGKIFIINKDGEIHHFNSMYKNSYGFYVCFICLDTHYSLSLLMICSQVLLQVTSTMLHR